MTLLVVLNELIHVFITFGNLEDVIIGVYLNPLHRLIVNQCNSILYSP